MSLNQEEGRQKPNLTPVAPSSRSPHVSYLDRIDPLHEIEFKDVVGSRWEEVSIRENALGISPSGALVHGSHTISSPVSLSAARLFNPLTIRTMAALVQFHQLSTHQLITLTGGDQKQTSRVLHELYSAGLLQRSTNQKWTHADRDDRVDFGVGDVWQIHTLSPRLPEWFDGLSDLEHLLMSGGRDLLKGSAGSSGSSSIRHNLTLAEIIIRSIEMCPGVIGGWGEPLTVSSLFTTSLEKMRENIADGAIVAKDGSIILIETSGTSTLDRDGIGARLSEKALWWAAVAARSDLPLKIVFVNIAPRAKMPRFAHHVQAGLERIDEQIVRAPAQRKGREAVFVADAMDWFPFTLGISAGFTELESYSTETQRYHSLVPAGTSINPQADVVANTLAALHIPPWIAQ